MALQSVNFRHYIPLLNAVTVGFQRRFSNCLKLTPDVNIAMLATMTHPFFKLRWLPPNLADQQNRLRPLLKSAVKDISASVSSPSEQQKSDDAGDDYFGFSRQSSVNDNVETTTSSTNKTRTGGNAVFGGKEERRSCTSFLPYCEEAVPEV